jgi:ABC-2 type transport system permease protein
MSTSSPATTPTDRGAWKLVAARDFSVRLRDKGFLISTAITLTVVSVFIVISALGDDGPEVHRLGLVGAEATRLRQPLEQAAANRGTELEVSIFDDQAAAEAALTREDVEAVLEGDRSIAGLTGVPDALTQIVQEAVVRERIREGMEAAGASAAEIDALLDQPAIDVRTIEPQDPNRDENAGIAFIAVLLAYGQLFGYGVWVATGVIEEKASRVVEILLSAIRPRQLLAGKIAGIGLLGMVQLAFIAAFAIGLALAVGTLRLPGTAIGVAAVVLAWFVMGFAFYAGLFAVSGSLVSRTEELQNAMVPINLIIFVSFFISIGALESPDSTLSVAASILPFSSALAMPVRIAMGSATAPQIIASIVLLAASTAALVPLSARLYAGAVLKTGGRVKLRDAWRSASTTEA